MKAFLEEYGLIIVVIIVIAALLLLASILSGVGKQGLLNAFGSFQNEANSSAGVDGTVYVDENGNPVSDISKAKKDASNNPITYQQYWEEKMTGASE